MTIKNKFLTKKTRNLLFLCLLFFNTPTLAGEGVSIVCPCTFERVNDTKANISFSLSFRNFGSFYNDMTIALVGREYQGSQNAKLMGEVPLSELSYSNDLIPMNIKIPLLGFPEMTLYVDLLLKSSNGETIDRVNLTEQPINYQNNGYQDFLVSSESSFPIFLDSEINFSYTESTFSLNIPEISSNILKSTSEVINVRLKVFDDSSYFEKANLNYTLEYDANGNAQINLDRYLDKALDSHLWLYPNHSKVYLEFWKDNVRLMKELLENLNGSTIPSRQLILNNVDTLRDSDLDGVSDFNERLINTNPQAFTNFSSRVVEVGFSSGTVINEIYTDNQIQAKISDYITTTNDAFKNSGVNLIVKNIGYVVLGNDSNQNLANLRESQRLRTGVFSSLDENFVRKPDLIVHITSAAQLNNRGGTTSAQGSNMDGIIPYTVSYDEGMNTAMIAIEAPPLSFTHEIGHMFGLDHSKREDGMHTGAFIWSNGHGVDNEFATIMSYESSYINATRVGYFSTPSMRCGLFDDPCGLSSDNMWDGADNLLTLKTTMIQVGAISNGFGPNIDLANTDPLQLQNIDQLETIEVSANDPEDGDLSQYVTKTISNVDSSEYDYESIFSVTDSDGNLTEQTLKIIIDEMPLGNNWDFDKDGTADALTDGLLLLRYTFSLRGTTLTAGAISSSSLLTAEEVEANVAEAMNGIADIDGNGEVDALTDGLMLLRYLFGLTGNSLVEGAVANNAARTDAADIETYIEAYMPGN
ncbi:MAG: reprolysin-like metallopeptidase [Porticoccaceae bacterium]